ncbi:MAG: NAD(P)-dependent oxidoreductase [Candidatus Omnitrophota bacterium]
MRRILITGGAGFVGYHLALRLSGEPSSRLILVDNLARGKMDEELKSLIAKPNVRLIRGDLTDRRTYKRLGTGFDEVYHLAAVVGVGIVVDKPQEVLRINAMSTLYLLEWFASGGGKKLLFSSTSEAYAWTNFFHKLPLPTPEDVPLSLTSLDNPRSSYAGSKIFGELAVTQYCDIYKKPFVIIRYHNIYGPRMGYEHAIPQIYHRAFGGQNPLVVYSANHTRTFCYVSDAVDGTIAAMRARRADGGTFNIGSDKEELSIGRLAKLILKKAGIKAGIEPRVYVRDPITRRCPDLSRAKRVLGYRPSVCLDEGLGPTIDWYKNRFRKKATALLKGW